MTELQTLKYEDELAAPPGVAVCPYCGGKLTCSFDSWEQSDDGSWIASHVSSVCETMPDVGDEDYWDWLEQHSQMPYVYKLPVDMKVLAWVNDNYRFEE